LKPDAERGRKPAATPPTPDRQENHQHMTDELDLEPTYSVEGPGGVIQPVLRLPGDAIGIARSHRWRTGENAEVVKYQPTAGLPRRIGTIWSAEREGGF